MSKTFLKIMLAILLLAGMLGLVYFLNNNTPDYKPAPDDPPLNINLVNHWTGRFGITFETEQDTTSAQLALGKDPGNLDIIIDDVNGADHKGRLHLINATGLDANQLYYYRILINGSIADPQSAPSEYTTVNLNATPFEGQPLAGRVAGASGDCLVYAHLIINGTPSLPYVGYLAGNGTYTINVDYFLNKNDYTQIDPTNKDMFIYAKCQNGKAGGMITKVTEILPEMVVSDGYAISSYSNELTALPDQSVTPTPRQATNTPSPSLAVTKTGTPRPTTRPSITDLPQTGIMDSANPYLIGLIMICTGIYLQYASNKTKRSISLN